jgi:hypothetical protein
LEVVEGWPDIEREDGSTIGFGWGRIVVYNIANFFASVGTTDYPVVAIKRWLCTR